MFVTPNLRIKVLLYLSTVLSVYCLYLQDLCICHNIRDSRDLKKMLSMTLTSQKCQYYRLVVDGSLTTTKSADKCGEFMHNLSIRGKRFMAKRIETSRNVAHRHFALGDKMFLL